MGEFERPQSEDCLTLNLWTPAADNGKRPVVVWIHGGAFSSGAGSLPWYSGASFARNGDMVAVSINYRLGALGFLYLPGVSEGNLGLLDQVISSSTVAGVQLGALKEALIFIVMVAILVVRPTGLLGKEGYR